MHLQLADLEIIMSCIGRPVAWIVVENDLKTQTTVAKMSSSCFADKIIIIVYGGLDRNRSHVSKVYIAILL